SKFTILTSGGWTVYDAEKGIATVQVERGDDDLEMKGIKILFSVNGSSFGSLVIAPDSGETKVYFFNLSDYGKPDRVSVFPIFVVGKSEKIGEISSKVIIPFGKIYEVDDVYDLEEDYSGVNYYVKNGGDDDADGLSDATAWATSTAVNAHIFGEGDNLYFRRGDTWDLSYNDFFDFTNDNGAEGNFFTIGAYGTGVAPIINAQESISGSWSDEGGDIWSKNMSGRNEISRVWLSDDDTFEAADETTVDVNKRWFYPRTNNILYVYATENPDSMYTSVKISSISYCIRLRGVNHVTIQDLDIRGACYAEIKLQTDCNNIIIQDNDISLSGGSGISGQVYSGEEYIISDVIVRNNIIDAKYNITYAGSYVAHDMGPEDGISLYSACQNWHVYSNTIRDYGHTGIALQTPTTTEGGNHDNIIEKNDISAPNSPYCRGIEVNGPEGMATGNVFRKNFIHDCNIRSQIGGNNNKFYNNIFEDTAQSQRKSGASQAVMFGGWLTSHTFICHDNEFYNNTISGVYDKGIALATNDGIPNENNLIKNNIVIDAGQGVNPNICIYVDSGVTGDNTIENNLFYDADTSTVVSYRGTTYTVADANSGLSDFVGNLGTDPLFIDPENGDFRPRVGSPACTMSSTGSYVGALPCE
ncbi:MAG: right-handed parallel beta-helix repeat-containing protein, partial [Nanoarchaeota archaeon]|nr:right-handed parallel beta-helix repeat-containing protein [Nanoarchaeota archaeon]